MAQPYSSFEKRRKSKLPCIMRCFNLIVAAINWIRHAGIVIMGLNSLTNGKFFLIFSPIFMTLTGVLFIAAECKIECILQHFVFLRAYFGRGVFSLFMASSVFYYFSCGVNNQAVGWVAAILIFLIGIFYIVAGTCMHRTFQPYQPRTFKEQLIT